MLLSKTIGQLNKVISGLQPNTRFNIYRTLTDVAVSIEPEQAIVPDKLYKRIEIEARGNEPAVLKSYGYFASLAAGHLGITIGKNSQPRKATHERYTVLRSVHVHKKHRVQYETRTYFRFMDFLNMTGSTADTFLEYIERNLPEGVALKITKVEIRKLPETISQVPS